MKVTADSYRTAAVNHIGSSQDLVEAKQYPLAAYVAGLSVECMLRAYSQHVSATFDARHDLRVWYQRSRFDAIVPTSRALEVGSSITVVATHWSNSQRYYSVELLRAEWKNDELDRGIRGDLVKELTRRLVDAAWEIVTLGEEQWVNSLRKSKSY